MNCGPTLDDRVKGHGFSHGNLLAILGVVVCTKMWAKVACILTEAGPGGWTVRGGGSSGRSTERNVVHRSSLTPTGVVGHRRGGRRSSEAHNDDG